MLSSRGNVAAHGLPTAGILSTGTGGLSPKAVASLVGDGHWVFQDALLCHVNHSSPLLS